MEDKHTPRYYELLRSRKKLPVYKYLAAIESKLTRHRVIVVEGETGSGKTTQYRNFWYIAGSRMRRMPSRRGNAVV